MYTYMYGCTRYLHYLSYLMYTCKTEKVIWVSNYFLILLYFFIIIEKYSHISVICMYLHVLIQCCSFCSVVILEETDQLSIYSHIIMWSFLCHSTDIYMNVHTFLLQEELYSYCNRVKRSILEVSYTCIALYRSYYPDRQRSFISTWGKKINRLQKKNLKNYFSEELF